MYKGINIKQHNLRLKEQAALFLQENNIDTNSRNQKIQQFRSKSGVDQPQPKKPNKRQQNKQVITKKQVQHDSSDDSELEKMIADFKKQVSKNQPVNKKQQVRESSISINTRGYIKEERSAKQQMRPRLSIKESFDKYSFQRQNNKQKTFEGQSKQQTTVQNEIKMDTENSHRLKQYAAHFQSKQIQKKPRASQKPQTIDTTGKFTLDQFRDMNQPITKNYRIGNKNQWEAKKQIRDYELQFVLRKFPKIKDFKHNQKAIIKCSLMNNDVFVCMPTGGGKSLTFQAMTFIQKGVYLCILPLVSLIIDQEFHANNFGIRAVSLTGAKEQNDNKKIYQQIFDYGVGQPSLVIFCTPEKISQSPKFNDALEYAYQKGYLAKIVIDEVHCVSTWGKQFRQDYENLSMLRAKFPKTPILGLTATVTEVIKQDIITRLGIQNCYYFQSSFNRPNLEYEVREKKKTVLMDIITILQTYTNKSGIIYCLSRKQCEEMCKTLQSKRFRVGFYHGSISESDKKNIQDQWMQNKIQIIVATIAFGMGINKPDVRFVIHNSLSKSLENYYQESGRAGRDGQPAKCILFYKKSDKMSLQNLIMKNQFSDKNNKTFCMKQLSNMIRYCEDKYTCRRKFQLNYLGELDFTEKECARTCDNCKKQLSYYEKDVIQEAKYLVEFMMAVDRLRQDISQNQLIMICKGSSEKKLKYKSDILQKNLNVSGLRDMFRNWSKQEIDELITQLCSFDIFNEKIVTVKLYKRNNVSNVYLKVNFTMANRFLKKVEILPMKRLSGYRRQQPHNSDYEFDIQNNQEAIQLTTGFGRSKELSQEDQQFFDQIFNNEE